MPEGARLIALSNLKVGLESESSLEDLLTGADVFSGTEEDSLDLKANPG